SAGRRPFRCGAGRRRIVPLEGQVLLRPVESRDARHPAGRVRSVPAQAPGEVPSGAPRVSGKHRPRAAAGRARPDSAPRARRLRYHELLDSLEARPAARAAAPHRHPDGVRRRDGLVRRGGVRRAGVRARDAGRRAGPGAWLQGPGPLRGGRRPGTVTEHYAAAGVRLDAAEEAQRRIAALVRTTRTPLALGAIGAFGGMVRVPPGYERPVLVLSTDGVGTKVLVAARAGVHDTVGEDLVNHCVNDILVHGATPRAFLDYVATGQLEPDVAAAIVAGVARGCRAHDITLAGGETAQLPDLYRPGHYDLAGTIVGVVDAGAWPWPALFRVLMRAGDVSLGEMRRVFNLGIGMIAVAGRDDAEAAIAAAKRAGIEAWIIGEVRAGTRGVKFSER